MNRVILTAMVAALAVPLQAASKKAASEPFYVYSDKGSMKNHYAPSGWMGDYGDLAIKDGYTEGCADGKTCTRWDYNAKGAQGANWAGVFYQQPPNNWGGKPGGYDLSGHKRLTFWAKGGEEGVKIAEFKVGGITGEFGDSDAQSIGPVSLTKDWKKYTIDLADKNLSHIIGGFCWSASKDDNPNGFTLYLDEIRFE
jgi:hypothetical protein